MTKLFIILLSFLSGIASSTQGLFNGYWKETIDLKTVLLVNSLVVFTAVLFIYIVTAENGLVKPPIEKMTPSILVGGICGFFVIMVFAIAFPAIGATTTALLFISGLLVASLFYDHHGALNLTVVHISIQKVFGILLVVLGSYITLRNPTL